MFLLNQQALLLLDNFYLFFSSQFPPFVVLAVLPPTFHANFSEFKLNYYSIVIPMLRAVPSIIRIAALTSAALRSSNFNSAISLILSCLITPTLLRFGSPDALSIPASCFKKTAAGGVFVIKVN